jgi:subtilisin family serine protease
MRLAVLLGLLASLAFVPSASAATACDHPASAYSTGAPADISNPGAQPVNDPIFPDQWGLTTIKAPAAWARGDRGAGAIIAVVDTGVDMTHPDLAANRIDGADVTPDADQGCPGPQDENGHGTHVAGIAAAVTGNGIGVAGTAPEARIMPVRILDADGSADDATVVKGIEWAADHGADVINLSIGGAQVIGETPALNQQLADAVADAYSKGAVVVAAAGNESLPLCSYPAAAENAICVGSVDRRGAPSTFSNFPTSPEGSVGVRAPGGLGSGLSCEDPEDIWSTVWPEDSAECRDSGNLSGYETYAGTSMATPYVSGVAALLAAKGLSNGQILECIKANSSNGGNFGPAMGYGIVDADAASKNCSEGATPSRPGASGGGPPTAQPGGSPGALKVTVKRVARAKLARTRKLRVTVDSGFATTVRLRAVQRKRTVGRKRVVLKAAGKKTVTVRIRRRAARKLRASRKARVKVRYRAGSQAGTARVR